MTVEQFHKLKKSKTQAVSSLDRTQTKLRNKILNIRREPREPQDLRVERDNNEHRLQSLIIQVESQLRAAISQFGQIERELEMRLVQLLNRYDMITTDNGDA